MLLSFFAILPRGPLRFSPANQEGYEEVQEEDNFEHDEEIQPRPEHEHLLASSMHSVSGRSFASANSSKSLPSVILGFKANLKRARGLFIP